MKSIIAVFFLISFAFTNYLHGELIFNTAKNSPNGGMSVYFMASDVGYENGSDFDVERKIIAGDYSIPVGSDMDFVIQGGLIFDAEAESGTDGGQGFQIGGGSRMLLHRTRDMRLMGFGLINYLRETYDSVSDPKLSTVDIHMGATALFPIHSRIQPYAGIELAVFSDGDIEAGSAKVDIERDDLFLINLGIVSPLDAMDLMVELTIGGEQTFSIGAGF